MKTQLSILILFTFVFSAYVYPQRIEFAYYTAGNRVSRTILLPPPSSKSMQVENESEPDSNLLLNNKESMR